MIVTSLVFPLGPKLGVLLHYFLLTCDSAGTDLWTARIWKRLSRALRSF